MFPLTRTRVVGYRQTVSEDASDPRREALRGRLTDLYASGFHDLWERSVQRGFTMSNDSIRADWEEIQRITREVNWQAALIWAETLAAEPTLAKASATRRPPMHLVVLVLIWLVLVVGPLAEGKLPNEIQTMLGTEVGTVALGLAITQMMNDRRK